jgi:hypothetical protein
VGVDFPTFALSEARWDGSREELSIRAVAKNESLAGTPTQLRVTNVPDPTGWNLRAAGAEPVALESAAGDVLVELPADGELRTLARG